MHNHSSHSANRETNRRKHSLKRQSIKAIVFNFDGIRNKVADLATTIDNFHPDVIIGTETHINSSVNSSELFPPDFAVYRKDRTEGISKGGVVIAIRNDLFGTHRVDLDTDCEAVWVTVKVQGSKDVIIGSFYRSEVWLYSCLHECVA